MSNDKSKDTIEESTNQEVSSSVFTIPNIISFLRLCLIPFYLILLLNGYDIVASLLFVIAAVSDFLDGLIARNTNAVSRIGQVLDPAVDRLLIIFGILGIFIMGRVPVWIIIYIFARDLIFLVLGIYLFAKYKIRIPVIYPGKFATAFLLIGFSGLLINWPLIPGLSVCDISWLPGFNAQIVSWGIWFVYAGMIVNLFVSIYYAISTWHLYKQARDITDENTSNESNL